MNGREILDKMISAMPEGMVKMVPKPKFFVSPDVYDKVCKDLKRVVR